MDKISQQVPVPAFALDQAREVKFRPVPQAPYARIERLDNP